MYLLCVESCTMLSNFFRVFLPVNESDWEDYALSAAISSSLDIFGQSESHTSYCEPCFHSTSRPLLPGLYNLLSRSWLKLWRSYNKNPSVSSLPSMDCTKMLCHSHGLLVIPPHVGDYLIGLKKSLLGGLGQYPGEIVEILSAEEWDAMQVSLKSLSDFSVRFCLHGDDVTWNIGVCTSCCPFSYGPNR